MAQALDHTVGPLAATFFAVVLLNASLIGAGAVTLATQLRDRRRVRRQGSLHRSFFEAKGFYSAFSV